MLRSYRNLCLLQALYLDSLGAMRYNEQRALAVETCRDYQCTKVSYTLLYLVASLIVILLRRTMRKDEARKIVRLGKIL